MIMFLLYKRILNPYKSLTFFLNHSYYRWLINLLVLLTHFFLPQLLLILAALTALAAARPSFIAVPADQIAFIDLSNIHSRHVRVPRQTLSPPPQLPVNIYDQEYQPLPVQHYQHQRKCFSLNMFTFLVFNNGFCGKTSIYYAS